MTDSPTTILTSTSTQTSSYISTSPPKRKRRPAGTPEVIALSPKTLMESDRYVCEICNQGFQRDQNLQMHRRRHKVPWKLLKRADPDVRKRVYVCPEPSCLHHNPCHALGDLVGIKKHYRRKHSSMKQWECDKCSKAYAVQSDYKAHLKTCGTRGHCCDCGRVFSRVESFIEHQDSCTAASNKRGVASMSEQQATSLPSLAATPVDHHHHHHQHRATLMPTNPSSSAAERVIKKDFDHHLTVFMRRPLQSLPNHQECGVSSLPILPYMQSACPAHLLGPVVTSVHSSLPLPTSAPPPSSLLATILPGQSGLPSVVTPLVAPERAKLSWEIPAFDGPNLSHTHQKAELQLLPAKIQSRQLESSQSSNICTWPVAKDMNSTNSITSATICSSPIEKNLDTEKQVTNVSAGVPSDIPPCQLQLSIGFVHDEHHTACNEGSSFLPDHEATHAEAVQPDFKTTSLPWLAWSEFPGSGHQKHRHDSLLNKLSSPYTPPEKRGIDIGHDKDAIGLELATGGAWSGRDTSHEMSSLEMQKKQEYDYFSCKKSTCQAVTAGYGDPEVSAGTDERRRRSVDDVEKVQLGTLKSCNSSSGLSVVIAAAADQQRAKEGQTNLLSRQILESGPVHQLLDLSIDSVQPQLAAEHAAELRLQRAREKLKWALEEKLEAEKAWKEANREQEKLAEAVEQAGMKRSADDYNRADDQKGIETRKFNVKYNTNSSPSSGVSVSNSLASSSCQVSTSANSLQMQVNAGGVIISGPTFITCPSCHHTQILYHPANLRGTLFLPSQELPIPASPQVPFPQTTSSQLQ
ncbi:hypothetical protein GOP47_0015438 [Adiantum capillus-veneris]|uniref:C2H2-type domain-containing protein n=1 Tax=Adiantum capillus-veneris TaxID=13818 RepID=A0A9D4UK05_ADICA|nr:hypothetical protein GOP47_0015438 [Adiantum capillus-veneris]